MPAMRAERLCPQAVFVPPDFVRYRAASRATRAIFARHTDLIEPLSLDEAYLDVTTNKLGLASATEIARHIRQAIANELSLTASAGIAPNKFIAKIASDWHKPNGQFVVRPHEVEGFLQPLLVGRIPGVGKVMEGKLQALGIDTVGALRTWDRAVLEQHFGKYGKRLHELARGIDEQQVQAHRPTQSISAEDTFAQDVPLAETEAKLRQLAEKVWAAAQKEKLIGHTVVLKLKTAQFRILTRSLTPLTPPDSCAVLTEIALSLRSRVPDEGALYRLVGVGLSNFREPAAPAAQPALF